MRMTVYYSDSFNLCVFKPQNSLVLFKNFMLLRVKLKIGKIPSSDFRNQHPQAKECDSKLTATDHAESGDAFQNATMKATTGVMESNLGQYRDCLRWSITT